MKILVLTQYFWPESFIINDIVKVLRAQGHDVVVATGKPNYPEGAIYPGYTSKDVQVETVFGDVKVVRIPLVPRGSASARSLLRNYLSFVWSGLRHFPKMLRGIKFDAILVYAPSPITAAIPAIPLKWKTSAHLAIWVQDLWPQSLSATGFVRNRALLAIVGMLVRAIYAFADTLLVQSRAFILPISRYAGVNKIEYYPNSTYDVLSDGLEMNPKLSGDLVDLMENNFCIIFAGNLGKAQSVETIISAAERLRDFIDVYFVLVGSGSMRKWIEEELEKKNICNVFLSERVSPSEIHKIYKLASGLLVTLKNEEIFTRTIPSKIQSYLAAGKPIVAALNGEGARVVEEAGAGFVGPAEDVDSLVENVKRLYAASECERVTMGRAGRRYFLDNYEINSQCRNLVEILSCRITAKSGT